MPKGVKPDKGKKDNAARQVAKCQELIAKMQAKLEDPDLTDEEIAELNQAIADFQAKIDRLSPPAPTTPV